MDSSLPVLVSRLPDRRALARLVRAALRHEVAQVPLTYGPHRAEAHTLDLHVHGQAPIALLAEPVGAGANGQFPLRLRPLYRAQAAQLYALIESENIPLDGPPDTAPVEPSDSAVHDVVERTLALAPGLVNPPPHDAGRNAAMPGARPAESTSASERKINLGETLPLAEDPRRTAPSNVFAQAAEAARASARSTAWSGAPEALSRPATVPVPAPASDDPRRTARSVAWNHVQPHGPVARPIEVTTVEPSAPGLGRSHEEIADASDGALAEDRSLTVSVSFDQLGIPPAEPDGDGERESAAPDTPVDEESEPVLELRGGIEAPPRTRLGLGDPEHPLDRATNDRASATDELVYSSDELERSSNTRPPSEAPKTVAEPVPLGPMPRSMPSDEPSSGFFDDALANLPPAFDEPSSDAEPDPATAEPRAKADSFAEVDSNELEMVEGHFGDDDGIADVPPPPDDDGEPAADDDFGPDDDGATLIRLPVSLQQVAPSLANGRGGLEKAASVRKKSTRRKGKRTPAAPDQDEVTSSFNEAPVAPPPAVTPTSIPAEPSVAGDTIIGRRIADGKYVIESLIGAGASGAVYRATHRELRRTVAIKILHPHYQQQPQFMSDFRDEALAASQLDHPNVMRVLDFDQEPDGLIYIVMEYLSGRTLQSLLDEERRLPTERAVEIMIQVCAALSVAHDHGIIHRDIKPDNIMLVPSRNDEGRTFELVKVCDFGIAALQRAEEPAAENVITGTPEYMSPEQARGAAVDARSDVYACGICLYELVTGRPPFLGDHPSEILTKQLVEVPRSPAQLIKGLDPIIEEIILRAIQKDPAMRHQTARELRVELKELIEPGDGSSPAEPDERSLIENVPVLDDPASGFTGFFIAFASATLRIGRFERGHHETAQAMKELSSSLHTALRGRSELTFARRDTQQAVGFVVMTGTAEVVDLRRLLGSQLFGSFGQSFVEKLVEKGVGALTLREGIEGAELGALIELFLGPLADEDLRKELLGKPLRNVSALFVADITGRDRGLTWKVGFGASRLARDLRALCNVRGLSLKKMRETRDELVGGVARLLTRGDEVKQFILNADLIDDAVANLRGFSSFQVAPLIIERVLHEPCAEAAMILLSDYEAAGPDEERIRAVLPLFAQRLVTERSPKSDAAVAELYRRKFVTDDDVPRDLKEAIRAQTLADGLAREPSQFLLTLDLIGDPEMYAHELVALEAAMAALARRGEAIALLAVMAMLARHAKGSGGKPGPRESAALRTMKSMLDQHRLVPIAKVVLTGPAHQREAARQLVLLAGSIGVAALYAAREATPDPAARPVFVKVFREAGAAGWALLSQILPLVELRDDAELALVEDLLRTIPERPDPVLGDTVARFLAHPLLRSAALAALVPLWGERARKPLVEALEYADEPTRVVALGALRRLRSIDEYVVSVIERFLTMRGSAGEELRAAAALALADVAPGLRARAVQLLSKAVEGKRGFVAMLRGNDNSDESVVVMEAMGRTLLALDRAEGVRAIRGRLSRSDGMMRARLMAILQQG